jgi:hypothetical protein
MVQNMKEDCVLTLRLNEQNNQKFKKMEGNLMNLFIERVGEG